MAYKITCWNILPVLFSFVFFLPTHSAAQLANQVMLLELANRRYEGTTYFAEVWVIMMPEREWPVCDAIIWLSFNLNTLDGEAFNQTALMDFDPELRNAGYVATQNYYGGMRQAILIDMLAPPGNNFIRKRGGANGSSFRLGTVRWRAYNGGGMDGLLFGQSSLIETQIFARKPPPDTTQCELYDSPQRGQVNIRPQVSLYIDPLNCIPLYFGRRDYCEANLTEIDTEFPLTIVSPHWPATPSPNGPIHRVRYQYNFRPIDMPAKPLRLRGFNPNDIPVLADKARCYWEAQIDQLSPPVTNVFEWVETTTGGRFRFTISPFDYDPRNIWVASTTFAEAKTAFNPDIHWQIQDTSRCGNSPTWANRSEIVFNNTDALYLANPHLRWTTDLRLCGDGPDCIGFYDLILHETGHYLGLAHQYFNHHNVMSDARIWPKVSQITPCDADNLRRLYNPARVGFPIDNNPNCNAVTSIQEKQDSTDILTISSNGEEYIARYSLQNTGNVDVDIYNVMGELITSLSRGIQLSGEHTISIPTNELFSGTYFIQLKTDTGVQIRKIIIIR